jgi:hypothetical protein
VPGAAMALEPDAPAQAAGGTIPRDGGNAPPATPSPDTDVVVIQDGDDKDSGLVSTQ